MQLSEASLRLVEMLKREGLAQNPWPEDLIFANFVEKLPASERATCWQAIDELRDSLLVETTYMPASWCTKHDIHPRETIEHWSLHWTVAGEQFVSCLK